MVLGVAVLSTGHRFVRTIDDQPGHGAEPIESEDEAEAVTLGSA